VIFRPASHGQAEFANQNPCGIGEQEGGVRGIEEGGTPVNLDGPVNKSEIAIVRAQDDNKSGEGVKLSREIDGKTGNVHERNCGFGVELRVREFTHHHTLGTKKRNDRMNGSAWRNFVATEGGKCVVQQGAVKLDEVTRRREV